MENKYLACFRNKKKKKKKYVPQRLENDCQLNYASGKNVQRCAKSIR